MASDRKTFMETNELMNRVIIRSSIIRLQRACTDALNSASEMLLRQVIALEANASRSTKLFTSKRKMFRNAWRNMVMVAAVLSERLVQGTLQPIWKIIMESVVPKRTLVATTSETSLTATSSSMRPVAAVLCELLRAAIEGGPSESAAGIAERVSGAVLVLLQHLSVNAPETADRRSILVHCMLAFFNVMEPTEIYRFCYFIERLSRHPRTAVRCLALDLAASIEEESDDDPTKTSDDVTVAWMLFHRVLWGRVRDRQATVRARALAATALSLSQLAATNQAKALALLLKEHKLFRSRLRDEKAAVRRNTLLMAAAVLEMLAHQKRWANAANELLYALQERCTDTNILVRLAAAQHITNLAATTTSTYRERCLQVWLDSVLQLANDPEQSVTRACLEGFARLLLQREKSSSEASSCGSIEVNQEFANRLLTIAAAKADPRRPFLFHLLYRLEQQGSLPEALCVWLCEQAREQLHPGAWHLLAQLTCYAASARLAVVRRILDPHPHMLLDLAPDDPVANELTLVVANAARDSAHAAMIHEDARATLFQLRGDPGRIPALIQCLKHTGTDHDWPRRLVQACSELLSLEPTEYVCSSLEERACALTAWSELVFSGLEAADERLRVRAEAMLADAEHNSESLRAYALLALGKLCLRGDTSLAQHYTSVFLHELETSPSTVLRNNAVLILADMCRVFSWLADQYAVRIAAAMRDPSVLVRRQATTVLVGLLEEEYIKPKKDGLIFLFLSVTQDEDQVVSKIARQCLERILFPRYPAMRVHQFLESLFYFNDCTVHVRYNQHAGLHQSASERARFTLPGKAAARHRIYNYLLSHSSDEQVLMTADRLSAEIIGGFLDGDMGAVPDVLDTDPGVRNLILDALQLLANRSLSGERWQSHSRTTATTAIEWAAEVDPALMMWLPPPEPPCQPSATRSAAPEARSAPHSDPQTELSLAKTDMKHDTSKSAEHATGHATMHAFRGHLLPVLARRSLEQTILPILMELRQQLERIGHPLVGHVIHAIREQVRPYASDLLTLLHSDLVFARELAYELRKEASAARRRGQKNPNPPARPIQTKTPEAATALSATPNPRCTRSSAGKGKRRQSVGLDHEPLMELNRASSPRTPATQLIAARMGGEDILTSLRRRRQSGSGQKANTTSTARRVTIVDHPVTEYPVTASQDPSSRSCTSRMLQRSRRSSLSASIDRKTDTPLTPDLLNAVDALSVSFDVTGSVDTYRGLRHHSRRNASYLARSREES
ncbi:Condensin-2 complex subunit D3 [Cyanidiococcus yangmingshanensis]|uniref:Condensin-2 complex subunit D3 n=1 Tax=Cyanidiococcus yangmingshanensis TaxID=2690220 RepID=A0A7J7IQ60_9RHOD|nr:Condensin-2 complex subunit D3 [Cyanidiococcus yangmingshanensis]